MTLLMERIAQASEKGFSVVDSTDVALVVKYIGSQASGKVQTTAGAILFTHGAVGAEAADTTIGAPALNGTIDITNTTADTFGEVVDLINASANWIAYLVDVLRSDSANASTGSLTVISATQAKVTGGLQLTKITSKVLNISKALRYADYPNDGFKKDGKNVKFAIEAGKWSEVLNVISTNTFVSGTSLIEIHAISRLDGTSRKIFSASGGATTVQQTLTLNDNNGRGPASNPDEYLLVRLVGSAACTGALQVIGKVI